MLSINHALRRVTAALKEIEQLQQCEFPYKHSFDALDLLKLKFLRLQSLLQKISPATHKDVIDDVCAVSLDKLYTYVPILGFILRSTDVRNAFEAYSPLLRLAQSILGEDTKLIMSSEWEYSPFIYLTLSELEGFVLIGLPATESSNPHLIPLAGHELGHSVWANEGFSSQLLEKIRQDILIKLTTEYWDSYSSLYPKYEKSKLLADDNWLVQLTWVPAYTWASMQVEEIFCDFFGLRLFAESYLHAFAYLISPGLKGQRPLQYPSITRRVTHLVDAAKKVGIEVPPEFKSSFINQSEPIEPATLLLVSIADQVSASFVPELIQETENISKEKNIPVRDPVEVSLISKHFEQLIAPMSEPKSLINVLNASWKCFINPDFWNSTNQIEPENRDRVLGDLVLKSIEVSEYYERLGKLR